MEQSANPAARVGHYTRTISTSTQNASIWSLTAAAPSDKCFSCAVYRFAYLLTYLLVRGKSQNLGLQNMVSKKLLGLKKLQNRVAWCKAHLETFTRHSIV